MKISKIKKNRGFVVLFAVTLAAILFSIALGIANIALKEIKFGTSAKDTNDAFFAGDTGVECALFNDKSPTHFPTAGPATAISCASATPVFNAGVYSFIVTGLGSSALACANVTVDKSNPAITHVVSKGYNIGDATCSSSNPNRVERQITVSY